MSEFWRMDAVEIVELVRKREVSAAEVTDSALSRLSAVNPSINAVVQHMPEEALSAAREIDKQVSKGEDPGILAGVPVTTKVNVDQKGFATTNGLRLQRELIAEDDNPVVSNLRRAGAVIIGRTNTPAFSLRWFTRNSLHGHTLNPLNPSITPGGSSGGAAAATACGIGAIGHGTDIGGSIRYPAYACGIHGIRPTFGRVPAANFTTPDRHVGGQLMAVSGPLARTLPDLRIALQAMAAGDSRDPWWMPVPHEMPAQEKKVALCIEPSGMKTEAAVRDTLIEAARKLEAAGWIVEEVECPDLREPAQLQAVLWLAEFRRGAAGLIEKEADPDACFVFEQMNRLSPPADVNALLDCIQRRVTLMREWHLFLEDYPVMLCPVSGELPFPDLLDVQSPEAFDRIIEAQLLQIAIPFIGLPGLVVTTGIGENSVPVGVQLIGDRFREDTLFAAGDAINAGNPQIVPVDPA